MHTVLIAVSHVRYGLWPFARICCDTNRECEHRYCCRIDQDTHCFCYINADPNGHKISYAHEDTDCYTTSTDSDAYALSDSCTCNRRYRETRTTSSDITGQS